MRLSDPLVFSDAEAVLIDDRRDGNYGTGSDRTGGIGYGAMYVSSR